MSARPIVSIVLPTHNGQRYLDQSIQSCVDQTFGDWELILVDDASTDDTASIMARYARSDPRIHAIHHPVNRRLPAALNTGFAASRGKLLTWTSDDNRYRPEALAEMVAFLRTEPSVDMVYCDYSTIDESGRVTGKIDAQPAREIGFMNVVGACFLYRRAVHDRLGGYDEGLFCAEDYEYWLRASQYFGFRPLNRDLYLYRYHPQSLTATGATQARLATERVLAHHLPRMRWLDGRARAKGFLLTLGRLAARRHAPEQARLYALRGLLAAPRYIIHHHADLLAQLVLGAKAADSMRWPYRWLKNALA